MQACFAARWGSFQKADLQAEEEGLLKINTEVTAAGPKQ
jgi:hypothetical protein